jgi:hypothetical protein
VRLTSSPPTLIAALPPLRTSYQPLPSVGIDFRHPLPQSPTATVSVLSAYPRGTRCEVLLLYVRAVQRWTRCKQCGRRPCQRAHQRESAAALLPSTTTMTVRILACSTEAAAVACGRHPHTLDAVHGASPHAICVISWVSSPVLHGRRSSRRRCAPPSVISFPPHSDTPTKARDTLAHTMRSFLTGFTGRDGPLLSSLHGNLWCTRRGARVTTRNYRRWWPLVL